MLKNSEKASNSQKQTPKHNQNSKTNPETAQQENFSLPEGGQNGLSPYTPRQRPKRRLHKN
jgi:hypothetical protein